MSYKYSVDEIKYRVKPEERYIRVNGWGFDTTGMDVSFTAEIDGFEVECYVKPYVKKDIIIKYQKRYEVPEKTGFYVKAPVPDGVEPEHFSLYAHIKNVRKTLVSVSRHKIEEIRDDSTVSYGIDAMALNDKKIVIQGWATSIYGLSKLKYSLEDSDGNIPDNFRIVLGTREDVVESGLVDEADVCCGFDMEFAYEADQTYIFEISDGRRVKRCIFTPDQVRRHKRLERNMQLMKKAVKAVNKKSIKKGLDYIKENGLRGFKSYVAYKLDAKGTPYNEWFEKQRPTTDELEQQRKTEFKIQPKISIIVPTYKTPIHFLREMIDSVIAQSYENWELCIADGSEGDRDVERELERYAAGDSRIKYKILEKNLGIAGNTNETLDLVTGEYIGLFDHDDLLAPNALYEVVKALQEKDYDILYTDEDKITGDGKKHHDPNFKPDFSPDLFCSHNYITHFFVVKTEIMNKVGGFRSEYDGSQDYDLMFRCIENSSSIRHIARILYHWRVHENSVAGDPASKLYAYDAGKRAIEDHYKRVGIDAVVEHTGLWGMYHTVYSTGDHPLVSIIIPNKDHVDDLDKCIRSLDKSEYREFEIIIVENNSEDKGTFDYYEAITKEYSNVRVVEWKSGFNYAAINNFGVQYAQGEYLLFLNNDTEMITTTAISELAGCCMREGVGAVGAKLLYADDTVQHAGVVIGFGGYAGHVNAGIGRDDYGYVQRARINCNYSAVTAACMMTKKKLFLEAGGFDEQFAVACNDVDYCLKLRQMNQWIIYNAFSEWYHYESKSRGYEDTPEKVRRFENEVAKFRAKWPDILEKGDPFYNPNFAIDQAPFTLS